MTHELGHKWKSKVGAAGDDKEFDLTNMSQGGDVKDCKHDGKDITGFTDDLHIPEAPDARYLVRINEDISDQVHKHYRGVAMFDPVKREITKIVGIKFITRTFVPLTETDVEAALKRKEADVVAAAPQDEATWVATKTP